MPVKPVSCTNLRTEFPPARVEWLWEGVLARGAMTLLVSPSKVGKTTLLALLLQQMQAGGQLLGRAVSAGLALVISEESTFHWRLRAEKLGLGDSAQLLSRPFATRPKLQEFCDYTDEVVERAKAHGHKLIVIDTLGEFLAGVENNSAAVGQALAPFRVFAEGGGTVLILHHPRKASSKPGQAARGSGALTGMVDTVIELDGNGALPTDRQRTLRLWSRFDVVPEFVYELNAEGDQAINKTTSRPATTAQVVEQVLTKAQWMVTQDEILEQWPEGPARPKGTKLFDILQARVELGELVRIGEGEQHKPFRYGQAGRDLPEKRSFLLHGFPMLTMKQVLDSYKNAPLGYSQ